MSCIDTALTVLFYHGGCYIEYLLKLHDGARVFPVHAVRCVQHYTHHGVVITSILLYAFFTVGFGVYSALVYSAAHVSSWKCMRAFATVSTTHYPAMYVHIMHSIQGIGLFLFSKDTLRFMHTYILLVFSMSVIFVCRLRAMG